MSPLATNQQLPVLLCCSHLLGVCLDWVSLVYIPTFIIWVFPVSKICVFPVYLFYYFFYHYGQLNIYFILWLANTIIIYFVAQTVPLWLFTCLGWHLCPDFPHLLFFFLQEDSVKVTERTQRAGAQVQSLTQHGPLSNPQA